MSILTRVLIVFTFLMSIIFCGYHMALYNARSNHRELADKITAQYIAEKDAHKELRTIHTSTVANLRNEIMKLNDVNRDIALRDQNFLQKIAERDKKFRDLQADFKDRGKLLKSAQAWATTANAQIADLQKLLKKSESQTKNALDELNLLVDLAHTEEQQKIIYREQVKGLKIDVDNQQYQLQLKDNRLQAYIKKFGMFPGEIIPEIDGKVTGVDGGVVVINQGSIMGVQKGYVFSITRGGSFITKAIVKEVYDKRCVCYIDEAYNQKNDLGMVIAVEKHDNASTK